MEKLNQLVGNIAVNNFIYFSDDEISSDGRGSTKALHITITCKGYILPKVLIDNGSSLNAMPLSTLSKLLIDMSYMKCSYIVVKAFDGTRQEVMGNIKLQLHIDPFNTTLISKS